MTKQNTSVLAIEIGKTLKLLNISVSEQVSVNAFEVILLDTETYEEDAARAINNFIKKNNIAGATVVLSQPVSSVCIKNLSLPIMPLKEMEAAIKWQLKDEIDPEPHKTIMDIEVVRTIDNEDGSKSNEIVCAIADRTLVDKNIAIMDKTGLNIASINISPFGYAAIFDRFDLSSDDEAVALLELADDSYCLYIYSFGKLKFFRSLPGSSEKFEHTLADLFSVGSEEGAPYMNGAGNINILKQPPEKIVQEIKLSTSLCHRMINRLSEDIKLSLDYYNESSELHVKKLYIAGLSSSVHVLSEYLNTDLAAEVAPLYLEDKVGMPAGSAASSLFGMYGLLGLSLSIGGKVNLLPWEYKMRRMEEFAKIALRMTSIFMTAVLMLIYIFTNAENDNYEKRLTSAVSELGTISGHKMLNEQKSALAQLGAQIKSGELRAAMILKIFSKIIPEKMFIKEFTLNQESMSGKIVGLIKTDKTDAGDILTHFVKDLESYKMVSDADLVAIKSDKIEGIETARFAINYNLRK